MAFKMKKWMWPAVGIAVLVIAYMLITPTLGQNMSMCPGTQYYCPGVGCVSGADKCIPGNRGGASAVFSKETFVAPPNMKRCPDGTRTDGPCLMEF
jgi:hypothetical protein